MLDKRISSVNWLRVHFDPIRRKTSKPSLWNSCVSVQREFYKAVILERCVSDFDYQQNIGRPWQRARVEIVTPAKKRQIRLRLRVIVKLDRALYANNYVETKTSNRLSKAVDAGGVTRSNGRHLDYFSFDQLKAVILRQNAGFCHPLEVGNREHVLCDL